MASNELIDKTKECLASTFVMYMKAHGYHWNVIGSDFPQLHDFFADIYGELHGAIDGIAEGIRTIDGFPQGTLARMIQLSDVKEDEKIPPAAKMVTNLIDANDAVMKCVTEAYTMAENENEFALSNFLQDRLTAHAKHGWMLKATAGRTK
jgi:starvation-inducible DNA-binding protein